MRLDYQTSANLCWLLDNKVAPSSAELSELAGVICDDSDPNVILPLLLQVKQLPDADQVTSAWRTFEERVALLVPLLSHQSERNTSKLLNFSQTVTNALRERLQECTGARETTTVESLMARVGHLTTIQQVNNVANSTLDLEQVLDLTARAVTEVLNIDDCSIYLFDEELNRLTLRATTGLNPVAVGQVHVNLGEGVTGRAAQHGEPVALENAMEDPRYVHDPGLIDEPMHGLLAVPIILFAVNRLIGVLDIQTHLPREFSKDEIGFAETVCGQVAIAIENARLYEQTDEKLREKVSQLTTLQHVGASIASILDLSQVLEMIARHAAELSSADQAAIFQIDENDREIFIVAGYNLSDQYKTWRIRVGEGAIGRSIAEQTLVRVEDTLNDPILTTEYPQIMEEGIRSMFCVPLIAHDRVLGGISVFTRERQEFTEEQVELVSTFAYDAALAIENARLYREAQRALETQAVLMREMQHRVKNNLQTVASLLSLQMRRAESSEAAGLLALSAARVRSIAAVHELFSEEDIGLATAGEIANRIMEIVQNELAPPSLKIDFTVHSEPIKLGSKQATLLALVLNELISNAIMHGMVGRTVGSIRIIAAEQAGTISIEVWDSGKGMQDDFSLHTHAGLGLSIVEQLVTHELSGTFKIENAPDGGVTARVTFPAESIDFWTVWWKG